MSHTFVTGVTVLFTDGCCFRDEEGELQAADAVVMQKNGAECVLEAEKAGKEGHHTVASCLVSINRFSFNNNFVLAPIAMWQATTRLARQR